MSNKNEESERKSWESSKSESYEPMPIGIHPKQNYNPCKYCPMMYGGMGVQMYGGIDMQGNKMVPKYGRDEEDDDRHYHSHHYYHHYYHYIPYYHHRNWEEQ